MWNDEIVDTVRQAREQYVAAHHGDIDEIYRDLKSKELTGGRPVVSFPAKRPAKNAISQKKSADAA